ncbi:hypothetical protein RF11_09099 [Thelohanellus kitauei]|uniref:Uncharacterized protein n=1 Tax=Thelohanellus kitauei TaxID=669202 RepID=A0A0C2JVD1_THEKT|nr:hypothetical protein RF11_09099 [Thelohanellus kitauei]
MDVDMVYEQILGTLIAFAHYRKLEHVISFRKGLNGLQRKLVKEGKGLIRKIFKIVSSIAPKALLLFSMNSNKDEKIVNLTKPDLQSVIAATLSVDITKHGIQASSDSSKMHQEPGKVLHHWYTPAATC